MYMKIKTLLSLFPMGFLLMLGLSCGSDPEPSCHTFSVADSVCYCQAHPTDPNCVVTFALTVVTDDKPDLTPHATNGTLWSKGFVIGTSIYVIDRESDSPHAFWKFDVTSDDEWQTKANFPGNDYGLTGSANGKGYASSYASNKFWEYDPAGNVWTPLADLPFSPGETHWVEYNGKYYVPANNGIYEFNPGTKGWTKFSDQTSSGFGALYRIGDDMYWYNINNDYMSRFNLKTGVYETHSLPDDFGSSIVFNSPFTVGNVAYVIESDHVWVFDALARTWSVSEEVLESGSAYPDDVFDVGGTIYVIDNGVLKILQ